MGDVRTRSDVSISRGNPEIYYYAEVIGSSALKYRVSDQTMVLLGIDKLGEISDVAMRGNKGCRLSRLIVSTSRGERQPEEEEAPIPSPDPRLGATTEFCDERGFSQPVTAPSRRLHTRFRAWGPDVSGITRSDIVALSGRRYNTYHFSSEFAGGNEAYASLALARHGDIVEIRVSTRVRYLLILSSVFPKAMIKGSSASTVNTLPARRENCEE